MCTHRLREQKKIEGVWVQHFSDHYARADFHSGWVRKEYSKPRPDSATTLLDLTDLFHRCMKPQSWRRGALFVIISSYHLLEGPMPYLQWPLEYNIVIAGLRLLPPAYCS